MSELYGRLSGPDRLRLAEALRRMGETATMRRLRVSLGDLAKAAAGFEVRARVGARIVSGLYMLDVEANQNSAEPKEPRAK